MAKASSITRQSPIDLANDLRATAKELMPKHKSLRVPIEELAKTIEYGDKKEIKRAIDVLKEEGKRVLKYKGLGKWKAHVSTNPAVRAVKLAMARAKIHRTSL